MHWRRGLRTRGEAPHRSADLLVPQVREVPKTTELRASPYSRSQLQSAAAAAATSPRRPRRRLRGESASASCIPLCVFSRYGRLGVNGGITHGNACFIPTQRLSWVYRDLRARTCRVSQLRACEQYAVRVQNFCMQLQFFLPQNSRKFSKRKVSPPTLNCTSRENPLVGSCTGHRG